MLGRAYFAILLNFVVPMPPALSQIPQSFPARCLETVLFEVREKLSEKIKINLKNEISSTPIFPPYARRLGSLLGSYPTRGVPRES